MANILFETYKILSCHMENICLQNQVELDGISENMAALVKTDDYGAINTTDTTTIYTMRLNSCQNPTHYKRKKITMDE